MSTRKAADGVDPVIESREDLISVFAGGEKPKQNWRIGTEHEKFVFFEDSHRAPSYEERGGIHALLIGLTKYGWEPVYEGDKIIALAGSDGNVSLEPAGQFELSGAPLDNLHQTCAETGRHLEQVKAIGEKLGIGFLGVGLWPDKTREELPIMPKGRYDIMLRHMPRVGTMGLDMMLRTCTIQTNLDYATEADMVRKFRLSLGAPAAGHRRCSPTRPSSRASPTASSAIAAISGPTPIRIAPVCCPSCSRDGFGYERYADYMLDVPMYFAFRDGYVDAAGLSFRDFMDGKLSVLPGEKPTIADWTDHLSTAFPEVRLKSFLEMRGADGRTAWAASARCPPSGSACSMTTTRSTRRGTW